MLSRAIVKTSLPSFLLLAQFIVDTKVVPIWVGLVTCVLKGGIKEHMEPQHEDMHLHQRDTTILLERLPMSNK